MPPAVLLEFDSVSKTFHTPHRGVVRAVEDFTLACPAGQLTGIVGPSGCGKTTLLRLAAGLDKPTTGSVNYPEWVGRARHRPLALVSQEDNLLPWRTILRNLTLPMALKGVARRDRHDRAIELLRQVHLPADIAHSYPHELSGGMRRRAAVAAALAADPTLLLLDEPFSGVDEATRRQLGDELLQLRRSGLTILLVTHNLEEALLLGDCVVALSPAGPARRIEIDLPHPRDPLGEPFEQHLLALRRQLEAPCCGTADETRGDVQAGP